MIAPYTLDTLFALRHSSAFWNWAAAAATSNPFPRRNRLGVLSWRRARYRYIGLTRALHRRAMEACREVQQGERRLLSRCDP